MKKYISTLALCALAFIGLGSCNKVDETDFAGDSHSVTFRAQLGADTRTGLALKFVPNWINTDLNNVHLFETHNGAVLEGKDVTMETGVDGNYEIAYFTADYAEDMIIIVNPPSNAPSTRAGGTSEFVYGGIVAQRDNSDKYFVPATQTPDPESLIDPDADFLVGHALQTFATEQSEKQVNIKFIRPVAISRLAIMNLEGTKVLSVTINAADALVGSALYDDVDFEEGTVEFTDGAKTLVMDYGEGADIPAEGIFNAYFVSLTGAKKILSIEVVTDEGVFTKDLGEGKTLTFKVPDFKSIAVNMEGTGSGSTETLDPQDIYFFKDDETVTAETYDLYSGADYVAPVLMGVADGATVTYESSDTGVATVSEEGVVTPVGTGETTISAYASKTDTHKAGSTEYVLTVIDTTPEPVAQDLAFVKNDQTITEDTFDLVDGTYVTPVLTGVADGATVTYEITCAPADVEVATIDVNTGEVTPKAVGVAVITATASAVTGFTETTKSYTLTVTDSTPEPPAEEVSFKFMDGSLEAGIYLIVGDDSSSNTTTVALFPDVNSDGWSGAADGQKILEKAITLDGTSPITTDDPDLIAAEVELIASGSGWKIKALKTGEYLAAPTASYVVPFSASADDAAVFTPGTVSSNRRSLTISGSTYYFYHSGSASGFTMRNSGSAATNLRFYKKVGKPQTVSFLGESPAVYDLKDGGSWVNSPLDVDFSGVETDEWSFESSNTAVATVDAKTGAVTIAGTARKGDSATITITVSGNDEYESASASYDINIIDTTPAPVLYKDDEMVPGKQYVIVSNGFALRNDGGTVAAEAVEIDGEDVKFSATASDLWTATADGELTNNGQYLRLSNNALAIGNASGTASNNQWTYDPELPYLKVASYYLYYTSSNGNKFTVSSSAPTASSNTTHVAALYSTVPPREAQTIAFSAATAQFDLYTEEWDEPAPTISDNKTSPVTYSIECTPAGVATIDEATGDLTPLAEGTAVITATAPASDQYKSATATYTLTVVNTNPAVPTYTKVTAAELLEAGSKYIFVYEAGSKVFDPVLNSGGTQFEKQAASALDATITDGTITSAAFNNCRFTLEDGYYLKSDKAGMYLYPSSYYIYAESTASHALSITFSNGNVAAKSGSALFYWSSSNYFSSTTSTTQEPNICLYVLDDGRLPQALEFSDGEAKYDLATSTWVDAVPALSGAMTDVTYSSSDPSVATVDANGNVTPVAEGKTTITVIAKGDSQYKKAMASYEITVIDSTVYYYTKVNSLSELPGSTSNTAKAGDFIFVYEDGDKAYVFKPVVNGTPSGSTYVELTKAGSAVEADLTGDGIAATDAVVACRVQLAHHNSKETWNIFAVDAGYWIRLYVSNNTARIQAMASSGYSPTFTFSGDTGNNLILSRTESGATVSAYLQFNASDTQFEAVTSSSKVSLYKLNK